MLYLVRHADAGDKQTWTGPDRERPLTSAGHRQARGLLTQLDGYPIAAVVSSPALRCKQSVQPLADHLRLEVQTDPRLAVDANPDEAVTLVLHPAHDQAVWCTHGELIGEMLARLRERGAPIGAAPEWPKGSIWRLEITAGEVVGAAYLPPADV